MNVHTAYRRLFHDRAKQKAHTDSGGSTDRLGVNVTGGISVKGKSRGRCEGSVAVRGTEGF